MLSSWRQQGRSRSLRLILKSDGPGAWFFDQGYMVTGPTRESLPHKLHSSCLNDCGASAVRGLLPQRAARAHNNNSNNINNNSSNNNSNNDANNTYQPQELRAEPVHEAAGSPSR